VASALATATVAIGLTPGCPTGGSPGDDDDTTGEALTDEEQVVRGNNDLAVGLYQQNREESGNLFLSPFSITAALSMTYAGAEQNTESQMADVLGVGIAEPDWHTHLGGLTRDLSGDQGRGYTLHVANAVWGQDQLPFHDAYVDVLDADYGAPLQTTDFAADPDAALALINGWVADHTEGLIQDLFRTGDIDEFTRLVLANAIYFQATWARQFDEDDTWAAGFRVEGNYEDAWMMHMTSTFPVYDDEEVKVLEMPYTDEEASMVFVLPVENDGLAHVEQGLTREKLEGWIDGLADETADVALPRFRIDFETPLADNLKLQGMTDAFNPVAADFSGIAPLDAVDGALFLRGLRHKAHVGVGEEGTEAAAATGVAVGDDDDTDIFVFHANHPFLFLIRDRVSGAILFLGRVSEPGA